ncbi:MAG: C39 family peptidase [Luteolibacter sp.]
MKKVFRVVLVVSCLGVTQAVRAGDENKAFLESMRSGKLVCSLDSFLNIPEVWNLTPARLDATFAPPQEAKMKVNPYFKWLTADHSRASFVKKPYHDLQTELRFFGGQLMADEVIVDFVGQRLNGITFSFYNRGDTGAISSEEFQRRLKLCASKMSGLLQVRPFQKKADLTQGLELEGWCWVSARGMALLEYNPQALAGSPEFLRLKIAPRNATGTSAAAFSDRPTTVRLSELPKNVQRGGNGDVVIRNIPMVDQGDKGYCVVASAQRLFEYYGIPADQHQIAQAAGTDVQAGTSVLKMVEALKKIDYRYKTRFQILGLRYEGQLVKVDERKLTVGKPVNEAAFTKELNEFINAGVPVLWSLELGLFPEQPPLAQQTHGGHMRLIIGYNPQTSEVLYSDSWGAGHELKRMSLKNAYQATQGIFVMSPTVR